MNFTQKILHYPIKDFNKAVELNPQDAKAYGGRGGCYGSIGNYKQAIMDIKTAAKLGDENAQEFLGRKGIKW